MMPRRQLYPDCCYKGLIKKLKSRQKTIKFPALALGIAEMQRSWYMSKSSCLLNGIKIIHQRYFKWQYIMSFNEHCFYSSVYTTFINFINSFRFDTSFNFLLYIIIFFIIQVRFNFFLLWNRMLFLNGQLALSLQDCLCVNTCITMTLSNKCTNIFESLNCFT
jgi:hypothetical protein